MTNLEKYNLHDSKLDRALVFWRWRDKRRAVVTGDYSTSDSYLKVLHRRRGHPGAPRRAISTNGNLRESGEAWAVECGEHCYGLMRPLLLGGHNVLQGVDLPFLIAYEHEDPRMPPRLPILAPSRRDTVLLVRRLNVERDIDIRRWRSYECEHLRGLMEGIVHDLSAGRPVTSFHTELERELWFAMHPVRRRRAA
jgi:hypothetical protein